MEAIIFRHPLGSPTSLLLVFTIHFLLRTLPLLLLLLLLLALALQLNVNITLDDLIALRRDGR
jgi:hypothetical protein